MFERIERALAPVLAVLVAAVLAAGGVVAWQSWTTPDPFDPFEYTPVPRPVERIDPDTGLVTVPTVAGFDGPGVYVSEQLPTTGLLCSDADVPVEAFGALYWQKLGTSVRIPVIEDFPTVIDPGCRALRFENDIPEPVLERADAAAQWQIVGDVVPVDAGGVAATWSSEPFWLVPDPTGGSGG